MNCECITSIVTDTRWQLRCENLQKAFSQLEEACRRQEYSPLELAGLVQTYQFTFELCWKTLNLCVLGSGRENVADAIGTMSALKSLAVFPKEGTMPINS